MEGRDMVYPIVMQLRTRSKLVNIGLTLFLLVVGAFAASREGTTRVPIFGYVPAWIFGSLVFAAGLALGIATLQALTRGRPSIVLDPEGLTYTANFGEPKRLLWREIDGLASYSNRYESGVEVSTADGRSLRLPALDRSMDELRQLLRDCRDKARTT